MATSRPLSPPDPFVLLTKPAPGRHRPGAVHGHLHIPLPRWQKLLQALHQPGTVRDHPQDHCHLQAPLPCCSEPGSSPGLHGGAWLLV